MKIPNFGYHFARWEGDLRRKSYRARLPQDRAAHHPTSARHSAGCLLLFRRSHAARAGPIDSFLPSPRRSSEELYRDQRRLAFRGQYRTPEKYRPGRFHSADRRTFAAGSAGKISPLRHHLSDGQTAGPDHVAAAQRAGLLCRFRCPLLSRGGESDAGYCRHHRAGTLPAGLPGLFRRSAGPT